MEVSLELLNKIFSESFETEINLNIDTNRETIPQWDSFNHLSLIVELEDQLKVSFTPDEVEKITSVKKLLEILKRK